MQVPHCWKNYKYEKKGKLKRISELALEMRMRMNVSFSI